MQPGENVTLSASVSLAEMTTRRHYPGQHHVEVIINGEAQPAGGFLVTTQQPALLHKESAQPRQACHRARPVGAGSPSANAALRA